MILISSEKNSSRELLSRRAKPILNLAMQKKEIVPKAF